jgi:uncharacterized membrane protein YqjE
MGDEEAKDAPEVSEPGWRDRIGTVAAAAGRLLQTRKAIFQEELAEKGGLLGGALLAIFVALLFAIIAGLLLAALVAALLTRLLGGPVLGILATLALYLGVAAAAGWVGWSKLSRLRPLEFPATGRELARDLEAVAEAAGIGEDEPRGQRSSGPGPGDHPRAEETPEQIEARLREGAG